MRTVRLRACLLSWLIGGLLPGVARASAVQLLVPAYFDPPSTYWAQLTAAAAGGAPITAIVNPDSGPGKSADSAYTTAITAFEAAGGRVVGYVPTDDTKDSLSTVEAQIASYQSFYKINGIFLDEMTSSAKSKDVTYYSSLYEYIKNLNSNYQVIGNPGTNVPQSYTAFADTLVTYEDVSGNYSANLPETWTTAAAAGGFANIAYEVPDAATMLADIAQAESQNVGYVYFTDDGADGNPYDSLPSYFGAEVAALPEPATILGPVALLAAAGMTFRKRGRIG